MRVQIDSTATTKRSVRPIRVGTIIAALIVVVMGMFLTGCTSSAIHDYRHSAPIQKMPAPTTPRQTPAHVQHKVRDTEPTRNELIFQSARSRGMPEDAVLLLVHTDTQTMDMLAARSAAVRFVVSTSKFGIGSTADSNRTPLGLHRVVERYGQGAPLGSVFKGRRATGQVIPSSDWQGPSEQDYVLSRILRLRGLEQGRNAGPGIDSYKRYIYIHGTNEEAKLGSPASHGCIRMANHDVSDLFNAVDARETWCLIADLNEIRAWVEK